MNDHRYSLVCIDKLHTSSLQHGILNPATRMVLLKHKSHHVTALLETLQRLPVAFHLPHRKIKSPHEVCEAPATYPQPLQRHLPPLSTLATLYRPHQPWSDMDFSLICFKSLLQWHFNRKSFPDWPAWNCTLLSNSIPLTLLHSSW